MKIPGTSDWLIIGSVAMWCVGVVWYVPAVYLVFGLAGKTVEKALEMQRQKDTAEAMEKFAEKFISRPAGGTDMSDALKSVQNLVNLFDTGKDPSTPN